MDALADTADIKALKAIGLTYVCDSEPGISRLRRGKGFCYRLPDGALLADGEDRDRILSLGLPPAYDHVWICLDPSGHLQATGLDARGRKQYRYHADWQAFRSERKFDQLLLFSEALPRIRRRAARDLSLGLDRSDAVVAALVALLDMTHLRVGNRAYARENRTFGATTLLKRHMILSKDGIELKFTAKGGKRVQHTIRHPRLQRILEDIADLPGRQLFSFPDDQGVAHAVDSSRLNAWLGRAAGFPVIAKTFRTWGGSLAAFSAACDVLRHEGRAPKIKALCAAAADVLHNTPAVCRTSYIHPDILALSEDSSPLERLIGAQDGGKAVRGLRRNERLLQRFLCDRSMAR